MGKNNAPAMRKPQAAWVKQKKICVNHAQKQRMTAISLIVILLGAFFTSDMVWVTTVRVCA